MSYLISTPGIGVHAPDGNGKGHGPAATFGGNDIHPAYKQQPVGTGDIRPWGKN